MTQGCVTKLVTSFGSRWGRIQPEGDTREIFFNAAFLEGVTDFLSLGMGQAVEFDERADRVNGSRAVHVARVVAPSTGNS